MCLGARLHNPSVVMLSVYEIGATSYTIAAQFVTILSRNLYMRGVSFNTKHDTMRGGRSVFLAIQGATLDGREIRRTIGFPYATILAAAFGRVKMLMRLKTLGITAAPVVLGLLAIGTAANPARASYIVNLEQVGSNVVATGSGSIRPYVAPATAVDFGLEPDDVHCMF